MLDLDPLEPRTPQLPRPRFGALTQLATSAALHVDAGHDRGSGRRHVGARASSTANPCRSPTSGRLTFGTSCFSRRHERGAAEGVAAISKRLPSGARRAWARTRSPCGCERRQPPPASPSPIESVPAIPSVVLEAKPLASGVFDQIGLPSGGVLSGTSTGPGSGGGVGTGIGTGIGSGRGPGLGPGSGGGTGGGVYRPGGAVSGPRLIKEVKPSYTNDALRHKIQGAVVLEAVVTVDGCPSQIRVIRSLDPGGLDAQAVAAVAQWQFEPGRLGDTPVDVLVTIELAFRIW